MTGSLRITRYALRPQVCLAPRLWYNAPRACDSDEGVTDDVA